MDQQVGPGPPEFESSFHRISRWVAVDRNATIAPSEPSRQPADAVDPVNNFLAETPDRLARRLEPAGREPEALALPVAKPAENVEQRFDRSPLREREPALKMRIAFQTRPETTWLQTF